MRYRTDKDRVYVVLFVVVLASLGINIATLVELLNHDKNAEVKPVEVEPTQPPRPPIVPPVKEESANKLNIPHPKVIHGGHQHHSGYRKVVDYIYASLNTSVNPCDDFYMYSCGNFNYESAFAMAAKESLNAKLEQIKDKKYIEKAPKPVQQMAYFYNKCVDARMKWTDTVKDAFVIMHAIRRLHRGEEKFQKETQFPFYMLYQNEQDKGFPNDIGLAYLLGKPASVDFVGTLLPPYVDTNWKDPLGKRGYLLYFTEPHTMLPVSFHTKMWDSVEGQFIKEVVDFMTLLARTQNIDLDKKQLLEDAKDIVRFDHRLALEFQPDEESDREYESTFNPMTMNELYKEYPEIHWFMYTAKACEVSRLAIQYIHSTSEFNYIVSQPAILRKLLNALKDPSYSKGFERRQFADRGEAERSCVEEAYSFFSHAGTRAYVDKAYPTQESRDLVRKEVGDMASGVLVGFRSMIDQLNWMSPASKQAAYSKIDNLVKNIAFPDWVTDDEKLNNYYKDLNINMDGDQYLPMIMKIKIFEGTKGVDILLDPVDRAQFSGSASTINAWYQLMLKIKLNQLFSCHELSHGFDDRGVQWDGMGALSGWMDNQSMAGFGKMAKCVVDEYNDFCPLDISKYGKAGCVNGILTQGENIADNGGIRAAFRAYRNSINLKGPDPRLPDDLFHGFTHDQLFFLSFARLWCRKPAPTQVQLNRLLTDPHSPAPYRVLGTLQNFPAFKDAFNCPSSTYAPEKRCNVWVSEHDITHGIPAVKPELNIPKHYSVTPTEKEKYNAYKLAIDFFEKSVNTSADPCDDFYKYACGKYDKPVSFHSANAKNLVTMADQLKDPKYQNTIKESTALTKEKAFFDACVNATSDKYFNQHLLEDANYLKPRVEALARLLGADFTYALGGEVQNLPDKTQLGNALGYLSFDQNIHTLVSPLVDTNWQEPEKGYMMFLDQNTAYMSKTFYHPDAFKTVKENYVETATSVIQAFVLVQNQLPDIFLKDKVRGLVEFEQMIANDYSTDDVTRRTFARSWNKMSISDLQQKYNFVDWNAYMRKVPNVAQAKVQDKNFKVSVMETEQYEKMSRDYARFDKEKLVNYLFMRLLLSNAQYLPSYAEIMSKMPEESFVLGRRRPSIRFSKAETPKDVESNCVKVANELMMYANGRVFIDYLYPNERSREIIRESIDAVMHNVIDAFQGMVTQLDWMTKETKLKAIEKSEGIVRNTAFPDWILSNVDLDKYYENLVFDPSKENFYDMWTKLILFNVNIQYKQLTAAAADRKDFILPPGIVNAWYIPELNSITFPAGILRPPYFHPDWPASVKYGGIGVVAGHELIHGFDDHGVQWGPKGELSIPQKQGSFGWMDEKSAAGFNWMTQCVINEYDQFCPLSEVFTPNCVNGRQTQGENIADNGGIRAAFRAYRNYIAHNGPDPLLPDRLYSQFTHDQLFFLSFAQVWCEKRRVDDKLYQQLMTDPHAPAMYRVFGTLQNYPAFRTAFNCPRETRYSPKEHCNVWVPERVP
ncbi:hypothetical protein RB195_002400 [Necator americanus]|uniref:Peptidase family M13 n=2 Tax=Necator americanus TaxID=51031 RepID=A0ABR1DJB8_NECAM